MNYKRIMYLLGWILKVEGIFMLLPFIVSMVYKEKSGYVFLICALLAYSIGKVLSLKKPSNPSFYAREGFITTALGWIVMSLVGALPFYISGEIPSFIDALFEIVSGFTTTGASILTDVAVLSPGMLLWRSFSQWIGGMGVLVFVLAIIPMAQDGQNLYLMKAESPGPSVGKLVPRIRTTAIVLYVIYIAMTLVQMILLLILGLPIFDTMCIAFSTAGTGGFGILNSSVASYSIQVQVVITFFMMLFGVNFTAYFLIKSRKWKDALRMEELRWYFGIYFLFSLGIAINLTATGGGFLNNLHHGAFQAASVMTTSGYSTVDFNLWPQFSKMLLVFLMFIGSCAGSTGGGIKVSRIIIYLKTVKKEMSYLIHQRSIKVIKFNGKKLEHEVIRSANTFLMAYLIIFMVSVLLISLENFDFTTTVTSVVSALNNIGPGLGTVGPTGNFGSFSIFSKIVLIFDMLAGRLEIFPMLLLFFRGTMRK